jgi:capsular polysaccharide biosynthesis protein
MEEELKIKDTEKNIIKNFKLLRVLLAFFTAVGLFFSATVG